MTIVEQISINKRKTVFLFFGFFVIYGVLAAIVASLWGAGAAIFVFGLAIFLVFASLFFGDDMAVLIAGGQEVKSRQEMPLLWDLTETNAIAAGIEMPRVFISPDPTPNAFAAGRSEKQALVCVNQGLIQVLDKEELNGVIAHEVAHIQNQDVKLMTYTAVLAGSIAMLSYLVSRMVLFSGSSDRGNGNIVFVIIALVTIILAPIAATIIQMAISRKREFLADAAAADLTRYPQGLASALEKISGHGDKHEESNKSAIAHMYISPLALEKKGLSGKLFSTHPPTEERVARLLEISSGVRHESKV